MLYVQGKNLPNDKFLAYALHCDLEASNGRPTVGLAVINTSYLQDDMHSSEWAKWIDTLIHEFMHALVFSPELFDIFPTKLS